MYHDSTDVPAAEAVASPVTAVVTVSRDMQRHVQPDTGHSTWSLTHMQNNVGKSSLIIVSNIKNVPIRAMPL